MGVRWLASVLGYVYSKAYSRVYRVYFVRYRSGRVSTPSKVKARFLGSNSVDSSQQMGSILLWFYKRPVGRGMLLLINKAAFSIASSLSDWSLVGDALFGWLQQISN